MAFAQRQRRHALAMTVARTDLFLETKDALKLEMVGLVAAERDDSHWNARYPVARLAQQFDVVGAISCSRAIGLYAARCPSLASDAVT